jgi:2-methylaconitate cis-trans-isomerase PrpF
MWEIQRRGPIHRALVVTGAIRWSTSTAISPAAVVLGVAASFNEKFNVPLTWPAM